MESYTHTHTLIYIYTYIFEAYFIDRYLKICFVVAFRDQSKDIINLSTQSCNLFLQYIYFFLFKIATFLCCTFT